MLFRSRSLMTFVLALASALVYGTGDWFGGHAARRRPSIGVAAIGQAMSLVLVIVAVAVGSASAPAATGAVKASGRMSWTKSWCPDA